MFLDKQPSIIPEYRWNQPTFQVINNQRQFAGIIRINSSLLDFLLYIRILPPASADNRALLQDDIQALQPGVQTSAANRLIGEVVQSRRRPLLGPSPG